LLYEPPGFKQSGLMSTGLALATHDGVMYKAKQWLEEQHIAEPYSLEAGAQAAPTRMHRVPLPVSARNRAHPERMPAPRH
jgi:hypothetical protein